VKDKSALQNLNLILYFSESQFKLYDIKLFQNISIKLIYFPLNCSALPWIK